jgi:hypothetical protein
MSKVLEEVQEFEDQDLQKKKDQDEEKDKLHPSMVYFGFIYFMRMREFKTLLY